MRSTWVLVLFAGLVSCGKKRGDSVSYDLAAQETTSLSVAADMKPDGAGKQTDAPNKLAKTWKRSQIVPNSSRVMVGDKEQLALRSLQTHVTIDGFRARVVTDYLYANDRDQTLEGTFQLRLPEEASPYFFAFGETKWEAKDKLDAALIAERQLPADPDQLVAQRRGAWLEPKQARMVPREKAAFAYGETVRRRVDPGLVEWAGAGVFTARVYPLAPRKLHRIVVGYDVDLVRIGDDLEYALDLPEQVHATIDIAVSAAGHMETTPAAPVDPQLGVLRVHYSDPADRTIRVRLRGAGSPLLVGRDSKVGDLFATRVAPALPATTATASDTAVFLVDTSLSSNPDRFNIWLKLMGAVLDRNRDTVKNFGVLFFSVDAHWYQQGLVANTPDNVKALLAYADTLALEGATDLGAALGFATHAPWLGNAHPDLFLLSDGAATWGESDLHAIGHQLDGAGRLFAYQTGLAGTDGATLVHLTRDSGGAVFSVTGEAEIEKAATAHRARPWQIRGVRVSGGTDVLLAGNPTTLFPGQTLLVAGRGEIKDGATLELDLAQGDQRRTVTTKLASPLISTLAPRVYGQLATAHLEELEDATEHVARAYANHFRVTGRSSSLLMLESEADYERFRIKPDDDAFVVKSMPAAALFAKELEAALATLGDPKAAFLAMVGRLERNPDVRLAPTAAYRTALELMPAAAFAVPTEPLATTQRDRKAVAPALATSLAKHELDYDAITADAAQRRQHSAADALKTLSSLVEENPGDAVLARDVGFSAMELGLDAQAYHLFRRVAAARPHEPQTYRAMAQALAAMHKPELALAFYEIPLMGEWDARFGELHKIVELDYLRFLRTFANQQSPLADYARSRLETLRSRVGIDRADVVVTMMWNTDNTDVDLHVKEPNGDECFFGNRKTSSGGSLTQDVTRGYGPEMYVLPSAPRGTYDVFAHYFASDGNRASARSKVYVTVIEDWGTAQERTTTRAITLASGKDTHPIATIKR